MIRVKCEHCQAGLKVKDKYAGQTVNCPGCQGSIKIPQVSEAEPDTPASPPQPSVGPIVESAPSADRIIVVNNDPPPPPPTRPQPVASPKKPPARKRAKPVAAPPVEPTTPEPVEPVVTAPVEPAPAPIEPVPVEPAPIINTAPQPAQQGPEPTGPNPFAPRDQTGVISPASAEAHSKKKSNAPLLIGGTVVVAALAIAGAWFGGLVDGQSSGDNQPAGETIADSTPDSITAPSDDAAGSFGSPTPNELQPDDDPPNTDNAVMTAEAPGSASLVPAAVPELDGSEWADVFRKIDRFERIATAFHYNTETWGEYRRSRRNHPPRMFQEDGTTPNLSWRVELLPFLDHAELYEEFRQDEPWDSPHNLALVERMPDVFRLPADDPNSTTSRIRIIAGEKRGNEFTTLFPQGTSVTPNDVTDAPPGLVICVEAGPNKAVPWTKPEPLKVDPDNIAESLGGVGGFGRMVGMVNGDALVIRHEADNATWQKLLSPTDGDVFLEPITVPLKKKPHALDSWELPAGPLFLAGLTDDCVGVLSFRVQDSLNKALARDFLAETLGEIPPAPKGLEELVIWFHSDPRFLPVSGARFAEPLTAAEAEERLGIDAGRLYLADDRTVILVEPERAEILLEQRTSRTPFEQRVMASPMDGHVHALISVETGLPQLDLGEPIETFMPIIAELIPPTVQHLELSVDLTDSVAATVKGHVVDEREAVRVKGLVSGLVRKHGREADDATPAFVSTVLRGASVDVADDAPTTVTLKVDGSEAMLTQLVTDLENTTTDRSLTSSVIPAEPMNYIHLRNNLKQIGLAAHNYAEITRGQFPPVDDPFFFDDQGRQNLSWRVWILPYLDQAPLFEKFKRDEPWDSPHNIKLLEHMPIAYQTPGVTKAGHTSIMTFSGPGAPFIDGKPGPKWRDIKDGEERTIFAIRAGADKAVPWTKPADIPLDSKDPIKGLGSFGPMTDALVFSGNVIQIPQTVSPWELLRLITPRSEEKDEDFIATTGVPDVADNAPAQVRIKGPARVEMDDAIGWDITMVSETTLAVAANLKSGGSVLRIFEVTELGPDLLGEIPLPFEKLGLETETAASPDGRLVAVTAGYDKSIVLCDLRAMKIRWEKPMSPFVRSPCFSSNGSQVLFTDDAEKIYLASTTNGNVRTVMEADADLQSFHAVRFLPGSDTTALAAIRTLQDDGSKTLDLLKINLKSGRVEGTLPLPGWDGSKLALRFDISSDGRFVLIAQGRQGHVALVNLADGQILKDLSRTSASVSAALPKNSVSWMVFDRARAGQWMLETFNLKRDLGGGVNVHQELISVSISPQGTRTAVAHYQAGSVIIFDTSYANGW